MKSIRSQIISVVLVLSLLLSMSAFTTTAIDTPCNCNFALHIVLLTLPLLFPAISVCRMTAKVIISGKRWG